MNSNMCSCIFEFIFFAVRNLERPSYAPHLLSKNLRLRLCSLFSPLLCQPSLHNLHVPGQKASASNTTYECTSNPEKRIHQNPCCNRSKRLNPIHLL